MEKNEFMPQGHTAGEESVHSLTKKLRTSRILNLVLTVVLLFVGGSYAALILQPGKTAEAGAAGNSTDSQSANQEEPVPVDASIIAAADYMTIGSDDAPITLYEWTDYTCPYCGVFNRETLPVLLEEYVETGKVRIEVHDVTFIGPQAEDAAVAARAAGQQDRYFDYLFATYELGANDNRPDLSEKVLFGLAEELGLDMEQFDEDFAGEELRKEVQQSTTLAQSLGVGSVPFFVAADTGTLTGLQEVRGAQPLDQFKAFLDSHLERVGS